VLRKTIVISLLLVFLCANTEIGQLLKLPNLVHHFLEHEKEHDADHDISFVEFITIHYSDKRHHHGKDKQDHQSLPFKTINQNTNTLLAFQKTESFLFQKNRITAETTLVAFTQQLYNSGVFVNIWLPPKLS
jgi:hypothetical protein